MGSVYWESFLPFDRVSGLQRCLPFACLTRAESACPGGRRPLWLPARLIGIDTIKPEDFRGDGYEPQRRSSGASASTFLKVTEIRRTRGLLYSF